jgi:hypothetical protein
MLKLFIFISFLSSMLFSVESYQVAFETTECSGESGFATVNIESIDKIQSAGCLHEGKKLQKLLVRKGNSYATYTLTHEEAKNVMQDVKLYNRARLKMMENANTLVITK